MHDIRELHKPYSAICEECGPNGTEMSLRSKDGTRVICPNCFMQKPVPHSYLSPSTRIGELERLRRIAAQVD